MTAAQATSGADDRGLSAKLSTRALGAVVFAVRLWVSACLALYVAFRLELPDPSWAATTAVLVCQPQLGASLRKASFRLAGTVVGALAIVVIAALFPQDRVGFLAGLAVWGAACGFVAALLRNFAAYGAGLAGFTAAILAGDVLGLTGGTNDQVVTLAIIRAVEIGIGIVSAGAVLALTDLGTARRRLAAEFSAAGAEILAGFVGSFFAFEPNTAAARTLRRQLIRRVIALDPMIDAAIGEASDLRYRSRILQAAVAGLFSTIAAWRTVAHHLGRIAAAGGNRDTEPIDPILRRLSFSPDAVAVRPAEARDRCSAAARAAMRLTMDSPSAQLLADAAAEGMLGMARAMNGLTLIVDPPRTRREDSGAAFHVPDWLPPAVVAVRAFAIIAAVSLFWIETAWTTGPLAITFATLVAVLFALQGDQAYSAAMTFLLGCMVSAVLAGLLVFLVLPGVVTFSRLCLVLGLVLVPLGVFIALPWRSMFFTAAAVNLLPLVSLNNTMTYDAEQFGNSALAIVAGIAVATIAIRVVPPPSPATRTRRLLRLALTDLRNLARGRGPASRDQWEGRTFARLEALPDQAMPVERAYLAATLTVGSQIIRLRQVAPRFVSAAALDAALDPLAAGRVQAAFAGMQGLDRTLAALSLARPGSRILRRLRASILMVTNEVSEFAEFFGREGDG